MTWWPVWRTADTDISTNFTANYLSLIRRQQVISGQDSAQWAVGCSGLQWTGNVTILTFKLPTYLQTPDTSSWPRQPLPGGTGAPGVSEVCCGTLILFVWTAN